MNGLRRLMRVLHIVIVASLVLQLSAAGLASPGPAQAATLTQTPGLPPPEQSPGSQPDPLLLLRSVLDLIMRQAVGAFGWQVVSLSSRLDEASLQVTGMQLTGTGGWRVQALDEKAQPLTLEGTLTFEIEGQGYGSAITRAGCKLKGTLRGDEAELVLDSIASGENSTGGPKQTGTLSLRLTRSGQVSQTTAKSSGETRSIASGMSQHVAQSTVDRDGKASRAISVLTVRDLGSGEGETWRRIDDTGAASAGSGALLDQHWFQRVDGRQVTQYLDRFDLNSAGKSYSLRQATTVRGALGGAPSYDLTLTDESGKTLNLKSGPAQATGRSGVKGLQIAREPVSDGNVHYQPQGRDWTYWAGIGVIVVALLVIFGVALVEAGVLAGLLGAAWGGADVASMAAGTTVMTVGAIPPWATVYALAGGSVAGLAGTAGLALLNPDPYFVSPDVRPASDSAGASPVRITRVTGGLVAPQTALATETVGAAAVLSSGDQVASGPAFDTYNDRPGAFVGGSMPADAAAMGNWTWDASRPFGAVPSHTEPRADGTQRHYFVHAASPLTVGADDNIIQYVYLDPQHPPAEILLQFYAGEGDGEHRAYWGGDRIQTDGAPGTPALYPMGALPAPGGWVRLQIPADRLGLPGKAVTGILYASYGGQTWWGPTATSSRLTDNAPAALPVGQPLALPQTEPGAQVAFRTSQAMRLSADILDEKGTPVRSLLKNQEVQPGYQVLTWDAKDEKGQAVPDKPYRVRLSADGEVLAEAGLTISPLVARIQTPGPFSLVRGSDVPVIGEAYGTNFDRYVVEYGEGLAPKEWKMIHIVPAAVLQPSAQESLRLFNPGNLANWNVGLDEYDPWNQSGLNGIYTLRLRAMGKDGREAVDSVPVVVGRLAHFGGGGTILSPDHKARIVIPPLAVREPFALMAIVPAAQSDPNGAWRESLPSDRALAGEVYEVFRPDETFRRPATLELPYDTSQPVEKVGLWLGDGTPGGWHPLGGQADPQKGTLSVPVTGFTGAGTRALVAPFVAERPEPAPPGLAPATLATEPTQAARVAPVVEGTTAPAAFYSDLESGPGEWEALDLFGTELRRVKGAEAGLTTEDAVLKVTHLDGGVRLVRARATPYDAAQYPILSFDYRVPPDYVPNLLVRSDGTWWQLLLSHAGPESNYTRSAHFYSVSAPPLIADDTWHHGQIDLLALLRASKPEATRYQVDEIVLGQVESPVYLQYVPIDHGAVGSAYYLDNFAALAPTRVNDLTFSFTPPPGAAFGEYSLAFDQQKDTVPPPTPQVTSAQATLSLPGGASDGLWYLHVSGRESGGAWSAPAHFPVLVDRQPPEAGRPNPPPAGAGSPDVIQLPLRDAGSGLDATSLKLQLNGMDLTMGQGLRYQPETNALQLMPNYLKPTPPSIANGQPVRLSLLEAADYAGNRLAQPVSWVFTADRPKATAQSFRRLTASGGTSPAVSPDGNWVAFVSARSGTEKVWVMRSDDYDEQAKSARPLTGDSARESDPAWSSNGQWLAFVSEASGSPQIWLSAPDGSGARAVTRLDGRVLSPTWSPDSKNLAFIRDGNLWAINADGTDLRALTRYAEQPLRAVRWQPGGSSLAVAFKLYQETIQLYSLATGELTPLTHGGQETHPAWLNPNTVLFTAPAAQGEPEAVWQINLDGSGQAILAGSGEPGSSDVEPAAADQGNAVALTSTRGGQRDVWLRAALQVARFDVSPMTGAAPGEVLQITYALPADADVTLHVLDGNGNVQRTLLDKVQQARGTQALSWDGTGPDGKPLAPGDYTLKLSVQTPGSEEPLTRFATARLLEVTDAGTLQLQINQWANQPVADATGLQVQVYTEGQRARPAAQADHNGQPSFKLPGGRYDVVVSWGTVRREVNGLVVAASRTTTQPVDLQLGALEVVLQDTSGHPAGGAAYVQVVRSDDPRRMPLAVKYTTQSAFVLPIGQYDVLAQVQGVREVIYHVDVKAAQVTRREVNLGTGLLRVKVLAFGGQPADTRNGLVLRVFSPQDHKNPLAIDYNNPTQLQLPAGRYDIQIQYGVTPQNLNISGMVEEWLKDVEIGSGQTVEQERQLRMGRVKLDILEAAGKPVDPKSMNFQVYRQGDRANAVVTALFVNTATVLLTEGRYEVMANVSGTELGRGGPAATFEVREGQDIAQSINLKLGHIQVTVYDARRQLAEGSRLYATAYLAGKPESPFAIASAANPLKLTVLAGTKYDLAVRLDNKQVVRRGQSVKEGDTVTIQLNAADFK